MSEILKSPGLLKCQGLSRDFKNFTVASLMKKAIWIMFLNKNRERFFAVVE